MFSSADKSTISVWKQLKEKFRVLESEAQKWIKMQDNLKAVICCMKANVSSDMEKLNEVQPETGSDR